MSLDPQISNRELVKHINQGERSAFKRLYKNHFRALCRFCWRYVESKSIAEGIVQEVFADIWDRNKTWGPKTSIKVYLYQSVKNRAIDYLKHKKVERKNHQRWMRQKENPTVDFKDQRGEKRLEMALQKAVSDLPERSRMVYKLHRKDGLTYKEIADVMEISVKTVESQMTRALKKLREQLSSYDFDLYSIQFD